MFSFKTQNVSETGFCLLVEPIQLGPFSRAGSCHRTSAQKQKLAAGKQPAWSLMVSGPMTIYLFILKTISIVFLLCWTSFQKRGGVGLFK
jgi:hypothetical protein